MTAPAVQQPLIAPAVPVQPPVVIEDSCCKKVIQTIEEIALQIFVPLALALGIYFALPFAISIIVLPIAITATIFAMNYFFAKAKPAEPVLPLTRTAPVGLRNAGNDCWLNSLAQMMRIDREMNNWFTEVPDRLDVHCGYFVYFSQDLLENLPAVLPPEVYGGLAANDPQRGRNDAYANDIRNKPDAEKEILFNYLRFLRQFPTVMDPGVTPSVVATSLLEFKKFMAAYDVGQRDRPGHALRLPAPPPPAAPAAPAPQPDALAQGKAVAAPVIPVEPALYNSHNLRMAIGAIWPRINQIERDGRLIDAPTSQQDPDEAFPGIGVLLPLHLKVQIHESQYYDLPYNQTTGELQPISDVADDARLLDGRVIVKEESPILPSIKCPIRGSSPNMQNFLDRDFEEPNHDPDNRIKRQIEGVEYVFPCVKTKRQFLTAPSALWLPVKRFERVNNSPWVGLHRMAPDLFRAEPARSIKIDDSIEFQEIIEIQPVNPVNGPLVRYQLDGFIHHSGACGGGHYISFKREVDDQGNPVYYKMDDSRVTRITETQWRAALEKAYIPHYSKIEEPV